MRLDGQVAFITGAARGLGRTIALAFAREGAGVAACDLADDAGLAGEITAMGRPVFYARCDVGNPEDIDKMMAAATAAVGPVSVLVNNAGITRDATLLKMTAEQWDDVMRVNLTGVFHCTKAVAPGMVERRAGKIINLSSIAGVYGNFGQTNYAASKAGVIGMTRTWARELGPKGINVNAIAPGFIATEMVKLMPPAVLEAMKQRTPLRRLGLPADVAAAAVFLASAEADFINGAVLSVDGGLVL